VTYPNEEVRRVLGKTLGVPLFQEQAMALSVVAAGFTPGKADELRRAMAAWRGKGEMLERLCRELMEGLVRNGYSEDFAGRLYDQIMGFGEYGFPESHAASFALLVYVSCWLKRHHPAAFAAALINSQPMGFYAPAQIVRDARGHGVEVRPVDVNHSGWDCTLEEVAPEEGESGAGPAIRLGMRLVKRLGRDDADAVAAAVAEHGGFADVGLLHRARGVRASALRHLATADAFGSMGLDRHRALWEVRALRDETEANLWSAVAETPPDIENGLEDAPHLPPVSRYRRVLDDYGALRLSLKAHPFSFARERLERTGVCRAAQLADEELLPHGRAASVAGIVLVRQRPGTASGILFMTLEDETGIANLIVRPKVYERDRAAAMHASTVLARGRIERASGVVHLMTTGLESLDPLFRELSVQSRDFR